MKENYSLIQLLNKKLKTRTGKRINEVVRITTLTFLVCYLSLSFLCSNSFISDSLQKIHFTTMFLAIDVFLALLQIPLNKFWIIFNMADCKK